MNDETDKETIKKLINALNLKYEGKEEKKQEIKKPETPEEEYILTEEEFKKYNELILRKYNSIGEHEREIIFAMIYGNLVEEVIEWKKQGYKNLLNELFKILQRLKTRDTIFNFSIETKEVHIIRPRNAQSLKRWRRLLKDSYYKY